ncbi:tyrosine-type recombinase/integrase [Olsenella phocaeensis]|uniref:tyrosine-type recombinase/integrase n=1 Tax=Olsenella phocaeensis TaxID=1852385 RepID=UPI003A8DADFE
MTGEPRIRHAADGTPYVRPYLGTNPVTGEPVRPYRSFPGATDEEALAMAREWLMGLAQGGAAPRVGEALSRHVDGMAAAGSPANTVRTYRRYAAWAAPLARLRVADVTPWMVDELYRRLLSEGPAGGEGPLSASSVLGMHWFLSGAWRHFRALGLCGSSPVEAATRPTPPRREAASLDADGMAALSPLLEAEALGGGEGAAADRRRACALAAWLALNAGLRCGEACGLRRRDVESFRSCLHVAGTVVEAGGPARRQADTKGHRSRNVALAPAAMGVVLSSLGRTGERWGRSRSAPVVTWDGSWARPSAVSREFRAICDGAGLPRSVTFHSLRHTHATWLLLSGADPKVVSERLGHADVATTLRIYGHVLPGRDAAAAAAFQDMRTRASEDGR